LNSRTTFRCSALKTPIPRHHGVAATAAQHQHLDPRFAIPEGWIPSSAGWWCMSRRLWGDQPPTVRENDRFVEWYQATTLRKLSIEAYQPKLFEEDLTSTEAARRIETLKREIALANSF
jgi:hypothetical protein